nr:tetratricopeptide repeat protein [Armatimonas sp.]
MSLTLRFLGSPQIQRAGVTVPLPRTRKAVCLLALLALHAGRSVGRKFLADMLWPEAESSVGATNLRQALSILRRSLGPDADFLIAEGYQALRLELTASNGFCDVLALDTALQSGDSERTKALYTGPFLEGFTDDWILTEREKRATAVAMLLAPPNVTRLPAFLTPFLGRTVEKTKLWELLQRKGVRLVSVLGMGGLGKTRLALSVATDSLEATFVDLSLLPTTTKPPLLWQAIAEALELSSLTEAAVCEMLQTSSQLLLLDNAEQVIETAARVVQVLLSRCPNTKVLITSRQPLQLPGEVLFRLQPLGDEEAVALFIQRAGLAQPGVELPGDALRSLCQKLEGLPLALELAAARLRVMQIEELEVRLTDRFRLLRSDQRRVDRHQTLQATLDGSWEQLSATERRTLAALSTLVGTWPRPLAQAIAFSPDTDALEVLEALTTLADKSWLQVVAGHYSLLETIREYLIPHQLPEDRARLVAFAQANIPWHRDTESEAQWLARLERHKDNLRAALAHAPLNLAAELSVELGDYFVVRGRIAEGIALYSSLLAQISLSHPQRAGILYFWALLEQARNDPQKAGELLEESLALCEIQEDRVLLIRVLGNLGLNARNQADFMKAQQLLQRSLALSKEFGHGTMGANLIRLGVVEHDLGNLAAARSYLTEAITVNRHSKQEIGLAVALSKLGYVERDAQCWKVAEVLWREALTLHRSLSYTQELGNVALVLGTLLHKQGKLEEATELWHEAQTAFKALQDTEGLERLRGILSLGG